MAFGVITSGTADSADKTAGTSITSGTFNANVAVDSLVVVLVAKDNASAAADSQTSEVTSVTDTLGNTYTKALEFCNSQGAANAGATVSLWYSVTTTLIVSSVSTVTANFSDSRTASSISAVAYSKGAGTTIGVIGSGTLANDGADLGSLSSSGLTSGTEYLCVRGAAREGTTAASSTTTSGWTLFDNIGTSGGSGVTNMAVWGEFKIASGTTSQTSDPTVTSADAASVIASFYEISGGAISGSSNAAFTTSGVMGGAGALSGASSVAFTATANGLAIGPLSGSSSAAFTLSGVLAGAGALSGNSGLAFSISGALTGAGVLSGASSVVFATGGSLAGTGALSGSSNFAFGLSGVLADAGSPSSQIAGSANFAFALSGVMTGAGALSGASVPAFNVSGSLAGAGAMSGASSATFAASGALSGVGALSGSSNPAFSLSGTLVDASTPASQITGSVDFAFTTAGALTGNGALSGSADVVFTAGGTLSGGVTHLHGRRLRGRRIIYPDELPPPAEVAAIEPLPTLERARALVIETKRALEVAQVAQQQAQERKAKARALRLLTGELDAVQARYEAALNAERAVIRRLHDDDEFMLLAA